MKNIFKQLGIRQKLLILFSVQIIIPLIFIGVMTYRTSAEIIQRKSIDYSVDIMKMIELRFGDFSENVEVAAQDILYDPVLYDVLESAHKGMVTKQYILEALTSVLRKITLSRDEIQAIAIVDSIGNDYTYDASTGRAGILDELDYETVEEAARRGGGELVWYVEDETDGDIFALRSIYNIDDYDEIGLMIIKIRKDELEGVYGNLSTEFMERIAIVTQDGTFISGTGVPTKIRLAQLNELDETTVANYWIDESANTLISYRDAIDPPWRIITEISLNKLHEDLNQFRNYFLVAVVVTVLILSVLSLMAALDIIDPINRLVKAMAHMTHDKVHDVIDVDRKDELGYLSECFNDMSVEIDTLLNRVYREQLTRKEAELKTLQAQINPHFLFNTLESINWMARLNEVPEISEMVTALSALMEAGIGKGGPMVSLREELNFVDSYVLILKNRYGDRLTFTKEVDHSCLDVKVPKLLLQPIIENAVYHGIDRSRGNGMIDLKLERHEEAITIEIADNGKGMTGEALLILNEQLRQTDDAYLMDREKAAGGIGLTNVNRRLKLFYGDGFGLVVDSVLETYTKVIITLPSDTEGVKDV